MATGNPWVRHPRAAALLLILTGVAGWLDAVTYLHIGGSFVSNQTGTVLLLAMSLAGQSAGDLAVHLTSLSTFVVGAAVAARALPPRSSEHELPRRTVAVLVAEVALVVCAAALSGNGVSVAVVVAPLGLAMGMQAALAIRIGLRFLTTGYVTGSMTSGVMASALGGRSTNWWWVGLVPVVTLAAGAFAGSLVANLGVAWSLLTAAALVCLAIAVATTQGPSREHVDGPGQAQTG